MKSSFCEDSSPCWFCSTYDEFNSAKSKPENSRQFFQKIVGQSLHLLDPVEWKLGDKTSKKKIDIPKNVASKIFWMDKRVNFAICNINNCKKLVSCTKWSKTAIMSHIEAHLIERTPRDREIQKKDDDLSLKDRMNLIVALKLIGHNKMSAYKATSPSMVSTYCAILQAAGVNVNEEELVSSRRTVMRTVEECANKIRSKIKDEVAGKKIALIHDDASSEYGILRAVTATFVANRKFQRRLLHVEYVKEKNAQSIIDTLLKVADEYSIYDFEITADGASTNRSVAREFKKLNHTCMSHTVHLMVQAPFAVMEAKFPGFKQFYTIFSKFVEKISRKHLNAEFSNEEGYVKIPSLVKTRWLSRRNCLNAIVKNWDILMANKEKLGLSNDQLKVFNNLPLFEDLKWIVNVAASTLLRFEVQKATTSHLVLPVINQWIRKNLQFKMTKAQTQHGKNLADEINKSIDIYLFGKGRIDGRIRPTHIVQSVLSPTTSSLLKEFALPFEPENAENIPAELADFKELNETLILRYKRIQKDIMPSLEAAYDRLFRNETESSDSDSSQPSAPDFSQIDGLTQEQVSQISNLVKNNDSKKVYQPLRSEFKKFKRFVKEYKEWDNNLTGEADFSALIRAYNAFQIGKTDQHMVFWSMTEVREQFPILFKIAYESIHIPASSCAVESLFSHVTDVKNFRRSKLQGKQLNDILTLFYSDLYMENSYTSYFESVVNKKINL